MLDLGVGELARLIARREVSAVEVVEAHLRRVAEVNPTLNAVIRIAPDAMDRARSADSAITSGRTIGALHGIPFTAKDWLETGDLVCDAGFAERAGYRPRRDATAIARMREAGAILIGKTNVREGAPLHPRPNNPHDPSRRPGSSSSGEAAIIAAGGSPMGLASDSGGSIRWPGHCCGVAALKPTTGLVPSTGHFPPVGHLSDARTTIGPMARRVADLGLILGVVAGEDGYDPSVVPVAVGEPGTVALGGLKVAWFADLPGATPTRETIAAVRGAAGVLAECGCEVREAAPPGLERVLPITRDHWARPCSISHGRWRPDRQSNIGAARIEESTFEWERFGRDVTRFMADVDVLLCPAAEGPAPLHDAWDERAYLYTLPWSLTRQPAAVVPFARSPEGLPIGVQVIGKPWRDHVVLAAAEAVEMARDPAVTRCGRG
jgi:amidase